MSDRKHVVRTRTSTWERKGFTPEEARWLSEISRAGSEAPYIQALMRSRHSLIAHKVRYGWSTEKYRQMVAKKYEQLGIAPFRGGSYSQYLKKHFYDMLTAYKDRTPYEPEWKTPRKKRYGVRVKGEPKVQTSRRKMIVNKIAELNNKINKAVARGNQRERRLLEKERNSWQTKLDNLR